MNVGAAVVEQMRKVLDASADAFPLRPTAPNDSIVVFAPTATGMLGAKVAASLGISLSPHEEQEFTGREYKARPLHSVRDRSVYVVQSLFGDARGRDAGNTVKTVPLHRKPRIDVVTWQEHADADRAAWAAPGVAYVESRLVIQ